MKPVFMIGTQRSGSNLLRLMLNQLDEIASPHPPHILERMCPLVDEYGDLNDDKSFKTLVDDVCRLVELNPVEWTNVNLDREKIYDMSKNVRSLMSVYGAVYDVYAESQSAKTWCCKSLANIKYANEIVSHFDNPKFIYLYRDGRDVALSFQKAVVGEKHIYNIAKEWTETQQMALDLKNKISPDSFFSISYEELTQDAEKAAKSLCEFLEVEYDEKIHEFHSSNEAKNAASSSQLWGNVANPVITNNSKKYKSEMSNEDLSIFESIAGGILDSLGYTRDIIDKGKELVFSENDVDRFVSENARMKKELMANVDKDDKERREKQSKLLEEIKSRSAA